MDGRSSREWIHPNGPFRGFRSWFGRLILVLGFLASLVPLLTAVDRGRWITLSTATIGILVLVYIVLWIADVVVSTS